MKKKLALALVLLMGIGVFLTGCGTAENTAGDTAAINSISDLQGKVIGMSTPVASPERIKLGLATTIGGDPEELVFYNNTSNAVAAVLANKIDAAFVMDISADFYMQRNEGLKVINLDKPRDAGVIMVVRSEDEQLKEDLNRSITTLEDNGTLQALEYEWIKNLPPGKEPTHKDIPKIDGAKTVYVGVCGDLAPLDYIAADGRPAGYNVALLTEIGRLLNINFEFVSIETQARFTALSSKKIDVIFCHFETASPAFLDALKSKNWVGTRPYYKFGGEAYLVKK